MSNAASRLKRIACLSLSIARGAAIVGTLTAAGTTFVACADENDPKTWVKRLDDPAQRATAIKRLSHFFEDELSTNKKDREATEVKALLDIIVEPLTATYVAGNLDDKTRRDLIKLLADTRDPRTTPALTKALKDYEPGKTDEDVKFAAQAVRGMARSGKLSDQGVKDALWECFTKFKVSKAKSINLVNDLHDAVLSVKDPSYGPKAVAVLKAPVNPEDQDSVRDQIMFWQKISIRVLRELRYAPAAKPLVEVLLTPSKAQLRGTANSAILAIAKDAEPVLIAALHDKDPDLKKLVDEFPDKLADAVLADSIGWISRPAGKKALIEALNNADNDTTRTVIAQSLTRMPAGDDIKEALLSTYNKLPPGTKLKTPGEPYARPVLLQVAASLYDADLTDWVLKEVQKSKDDESSQMQVFGMQSAVKLMTVDQVDAVGEAAKTYLSPQEQAFYKTSADLVKKCKKDAACYVAILDQPIPTRNVEAQTRAVKAARMAAMYGNAETMKTLMTKVDKVRDGAARLSLVEAIDHLAPNGDTAAAEALDKIVEDDLDSGDKALIDADDAVVKVAHRLRARAAN